MKDNKSKNRLIIIIVLIILAAAYLIWLRNKLNGSARENIQLRIDALNREKDILKKHQNKINELREKLRKQSEKVWKKLVWVCVLIFLLIDVALYFVIPDIDIYKLHKLSSLIIGGFSLIGILFFYQLYSVKEFLFEYLKEYSYKKVVGDRDAQYFDSKLESIADRIEQIDLEISQLQKKLD